MDNLGLTENQNDQLRALKCNTGPWYFDSGSLLCKLLIEIVGTAVEEGVFVVIDCVGQVLFESAEKAALGIADFSDCLSYGSGIGWICVVSRADTVAVAVVDTKPGMPLVSSEDSDLTDESAVVALNPVGYYNHCDCDPPVDS